MSETVGEQLRQARLARKIPLEQVAQATHIRLHYLQAIETGDTKTLPSQAQARGFLRAYASYIGLNADELLTTFQGETEKASPSKKLTPPLPFEATGGDTSHADALFIEIGQMLSHQRDLLGLSQEDVERHTHLRAHYLQALENGDLKSLPSPVQARGMLKNYAAFLGLETETLLLRFAEGLQASLHARRTAEQQDRPSARRKMRRGPSFLHFIPIDYIISGLLVLALIGFVAWGGLRIAAMRSGNPSQTPLYTAPSIVEFLSATDTPLFSSSENGTLTTPGAASTTLTPGAEITGTIELPPVASPTPTLLAPPPAGNAVLQVYIIIHQRAWMRVIVDGKIEFDGRVLPGSAYPFSGDKRIEVLTGNAAALQIFFNQVDLGAMGVEAEVLYRIFTPQGMLTPTATITFTPLPTTTRTPQPTATP